MNSNVISFLHQTLQQQDQKVAAFMGIDRKPVLLTEQEIDEEIKRRIEQKKGAVAFLVEAKNLLNPPSPRTLRP